MSLKEVKLPKFGEVWRHKRTGNMYVVVSLSRFSSDCELDGTWIIGYKSNASIETHIRNAQLKFKDIAFVDEQQREDEIVAEAQLSMSQFSTPLTRFLEKFEFMGDLWKPE